MKDQTVLWISSSRNSYKNWRSVFTDTAIQVLRVNELEFTLGQFAYRHIDLILLEASGIVKDDIDLCYRLRKRFDIPLILLTTNNTEEFAVAAYEVGVDECILGRVSPDLLRAKVYARIKSIERLTSDPRPSSRGAGNSAEQPTRSPRQICH